jgi:hypothetical protein
MKNLIISFLTITTYTCFAITSSGALVKPKMGNCQYMGYNILKCIPGQCSTTAHLPNTRIDITMSVIGEYDGYCVFIKKLVAKPKNFAEMEVEENCKLSEEGRVEMAKLFKKFRDGNIGAMANSPQNATLRQECK